MRKYQQKRLEWIVHDTPDVKTCARCDQSFPSTEFVKSRHDKTGLGSYCKPCLSERNKARLGTLVITPVDEKRCPKCDLVLAAPLFASNPVSGDGLHSWCRECTRLRQIERKYNITPERYREMAKAGCQIRGCGSTENLHVDHDHSCCPGEYSCGACVRSLLCPPHNQGLGNFKDDPEALRAAADYVERHRPAQLVAPSCR